MDDLPDLVALDILDRIERIADKSSLSLTCKRLHELESVSRKSLRVGCGLNPANEALLSLCKRFQNLEKVEICYSGWMSRLGQQLDDKGLHHLSVTCPLLADLTLSYCTFVTDTGLTHLASCSNLSSLKLIFTPRVTGCGMLSVVIGCKMLVSLHLIRCLNLTRMEWLEYLGKTKSLQDLCIKNCRAIGEDDLIKLGPSWETLKRLHFEMNTDYRYTKICDQWRNLPIPCESMVELVLVNCITIPKRGVSCILGKCKNLEKIHLDMCFGVQDSDIIGLARSSSNLKSISLRVSLDFSIPLRNYETVTLTDECLKALAENCSRLESIRISFDNGDFPSPSSFSLQGILTLVHKCPIRELGLDRVYSFNDVGMQALCGAENLEVVELSKCQEISDEGLLLAAEVPRLRVLKLRQCLGVTDEGLKALVGSGKLEVLEVVDCPQISERGVEGAADSVCFKQDLAWMY